MASLYQDAKGYRLKITIGEQSKVITLGKLTGKAPAKTAERCKSEVETILSCNAGGVSYPPETAAWLANIGDDLHGKLVKAGLIQERNRRTLGQFIDEYTALQQTNWKQRSLKEWNVAMGKIIDFFGNDAELSKITPEQAAKFKNHLIKQKYATAYVNKNVERTKQLFLAAVKRKLIAESPFADITAGKKVNKERQYFVSFNEANALIDACSNSKQRLIIALARWGGLRCPSELAGLLWSEVNWEKSRFIVHSPKTEHQGKHKRVVPIFPELYLYLREAFEAAPEGIDRIYPEITEKKSLGSFIQKTADRAAVPLWEKPFQNCRSTRQRNCWRSFRRTL